MALMDNFDFYDMHEREEAKWLARCPVCAWCKEPIQEDYAYRIDGELVCAYCIEDRKEYLDG